MNEQTKAIGRQAGLVFIEDGVYGQRWYSSRCGLDTSEYEKLVELIVRECAEVADNADATRQKWEGIGKYVREHFGVTE